MIKALIFDMDGLLVDSEPYWDEARKMLAIDVGVNWDWNADDQKAVMGSSTREWVDYLIKRFNLKLSPMSVQEKIIANMVNLYQQQIPFLPGARETVDLAAKNFITGLASGSPSSLIKSVTADPALRGKFQVALSGEQFERGKPAPDIYLATAAELEVQPGECVCFEDSGNGILAGKRAGMKVIAVPDNRFSPAAEIVAQADVVSESLHDFSLDTIARISDRSASL
jgi:HAD superfamily hydrolase (TIGR01509 family)